MPVKLTKHSYSVRGLVILLGKPDRTIRKWAEKGRIPAHKVGREWRFPKEEIDRWLSGRRGNSATVMQSESQQGPEMPSAHGPEWMDPEPMEC